MHGRSSVVALRYAWLRAPPPLRPNPKPPKPIAPLDTWPHMRVGKGGRGTFDAGTECVPPCPRGGSDRVGTARVERAFAHPTIL